MIATLRTIRWVTLGLIVVAALGMAVLKFRPVDEPADHDASAGTVSVPAGVAIGGPFQLTDDKGHDVTDADYRGRWMLVFFVASPAASAAYLTVSETFPIEIRALAIAIFYAIGTGVGGAAAPFIFGELIARGSRDGVFAGYVLAAVLMLAAALVAARYAVAAERRPLEEVARPLSAED